MARYGNVNELRVILFLIRTLIDNDSGTNITYGIIPSLIDITSVRYFVITI